MSDVMLFGVLEMPYEMAMGSELSRKQFHDRAQEAVKRLRDQEADTARLNAECRQRMLQAMENGQSAQQQRARAEKAEALLRECLDCLPIHPATHARITAHLGAEQ